MPAADTSMVRLATRGSALARRQALLATEALYGAGVEGIETLIVRTEGDRLLHTPIEELEGQGWFTAEIERSLLDGRADIAAHSAKDLPSALAPGLQVAAYLPRADPRDGVVSAGDRPLSGLPPGARVGTSSARRAGLIAAMHPALLAVPI
jgi:hydroxymethylbilane synthase